MCEASIYVTHRVGERQEHLTIRPIPGYYMKGFYPADKNAPNQALVCMRGSRKVVTIKKVMLEKGAPEWTQQYEGKTNVPVTFMHRAYEDRVYFTDTLYVSVTMFRNGTLIDFGYAPPKPKKVTGKAGMKKVKEALSEASKIPVLKGWDKVDV